MSELGDGDFTIPMMGLTESFNVSVAAAICVHWGRHAREAAIGRRTDLSPDAAAALLSEYQSAGKHYEHRIRVRQPAPAQLEPRCTPRARAARAGAGFLAWGAHCGAECNARSGGEGLQSGAEGGLRTAEEREAQAKASAAKAEDKEARRLKWMLANKRFGPFLPPSLVPSLSCIIPASLAKLR